MTEPGVRDVLDPTRRAEMQALARTELRRLLRAGSDADMLRAVDAIGRDEIETAASLAARLDSVAPTSRIQALLDEMNTLVSSIHDPSHRRGLFGLALAPLPIESRLREADEQLARLIEDLARERDRLAQAAVSGRRLDERMDQSEAALEHAVHLLRLLAQGAEAAGRELAPDNPTRASFLKNGVSAHVVERERDVLTQIAILRQGKMSLQVLLDGQESLVRAVDRTRHVMLSALRTAVAAARSLDQGARMSAQAATLDKAAARRLIETSVCEMKTALTDR